MAYDPTEIEDGTGKATSLVYGRTSDPVSECASYLTRRGFTAFSSLATTTLKEQHLLRATEYIEEFARRRVKGYPTKRGQALLWPRASVEVIDVGYQWTPDEGSIYIVSTDIPEHWLRAVWETAELSAAGQPLNRVIDDEKDIKRKKTDVLETEWFNNHSKLRELRAVDDLLKPFLRQPGQLERG